jgi:hypothetical protein
VASASHGSRRGSATAAGVIIALYRWRPRVPLLALRRLQRAAGAASLAGRYRTIAVTTQLLPRSAG